jgi:PleD family two-component response regulator
MGAADLSTGNSTLAAMIDAADQALFAAKRGGRDRVEIALPAAA